MIRAWALAAAWGGLLALPVARRAGRAPVVRRSALLTGVDPSGATVARGRDLAVVRWLERTVAVVLGARGPAWLAALSRLARRVSAPVVHVVAGLRGRRRATDSARVLAREMPVVVDLLAVAVGAGCTPFLAVSSTAAWSPPRAQPVLDEVVRSCRLGAPFADALSATAVRHPPFAPVSDALLTSERSGAAVGPALGRLADEQRATLRRDAEAHARRIPVRLLFPLVFLVLPAFVLLTVVPSLAAGLERL